MAPENFIEVSFEVANKVGGIHQVIKSKTGFMQQQYGENYLAIGYLDEENASKEFVPREENPYSHLFQKLEQKYGIRCKYGVWKIPGEPKTILVDSTHLKKPADEIKEELWEKQKIDSLNAGREFEEPLEWSYAVSKLLEELKEYRDGDTVVQLHEWLSGPVQFFNELPTVFTTHATVLGRALSNSNHNLNKIVEKKQDVSSKPEDLGVKAKHQIEKASAHEAEVFTTVSQTTGEETHALLDKRPDKILENGLDFNEFPGLGELSYKHIEKKEKMKRFLRAYFKPYYDVDLEDDPRILFISGRYEYRNKGIDIFIEALSQINEREGEDFFVFFFIPGDTKKENPEVIENLSLYDELEEYTESKIDSLKETMLNSVTSTRPLEEAIQASIQKDSHEIENLQKNFKAKKGDKPPISAYELNNPEDQILNKLYKEGLTNEENDRVKVIHYPSYLSVGDKMLSMNYNEAVMAASAGIFPSYYEPWGYTPVETAANGAISITTDLAGFGQYIKQKTSKKERKGIKVLDRKTNTDQESVNQLSDMIEDITSYSKTEITERKHNARRIAQLTSWENLGHKYIEAHEEAVKQKQR